jgi:hypothetical protein
MHQSYTMKSRARTTPDAMRAADRLQKAVTAHSPCVHLAPPPAHA